MLIGQSFTHEEMGVVYNWINVYAKDRVSFVNCRCFNKNRLYVSLPMGDSDFCLLWGSSMIYPFRFLEEILASPILVLLVF